MREGSPSVTESQESVGDIKEMFFRFTHFVYRLSNKNLKTWLSFQLILLPSSLKKVQCVRFNTI